MKGAEVTLEVGFLTKKIYDKNGIMNAKQRTNLKEIISSHLKARKCSSTFGEIRQQQSGKLLV